MRYAVKRVRRRDTWVYQVLQDGILLTECPTAADAKARIKTAKEWHGKSRGGKGG
jgi:hypothetical protein